MPVIRCEKKNNYTVMSNHHLRDKRLSLKARGLLSLILSLPDDWVYSLRGLTHISGESLHSVRAGIQALEAAGYVTRTQQRDARGRMAESVYTIYERPLSVPPTTETQTLQNTDAPSTEAPKKEKINTSLEERREADAAQSESIRAEVLQQIEYEVLCTDPEVDKNMADALVELVATGVHHVILGHLSGENNLPELAMRTSEERAEREGIRLGVDLSLDLAWRDRVGSVYTLRGCP